VLDENTQLAVGEASVTPVQVEEVDAVIPVEVSF
jgi:hypothetical protein